MKNDNDNDQLVAASFMAAIANLLSGRTDRFDEFTCKVDIRLCGSEPSLPQLAEFSKCVQATGRPLLWVHATAEYPGVPLIGLVAMLDGTLYIIENCMLWMSLTGSRASLVPDNFKLGAFRFDNQLQLRYSAKAPVNKNDAADSGTQRAYDRLLQIQIGQFERSEQFKLPELRKAA